jgi:hypothetical protein
VRGKIPRPADDWKQDYWAVASSFLGGVEAMGTGDPSYLKVLGLSDAPYRLDDESLKTIRRAVREMLAAIRNGHPISTTGPDPEDATKADAALQRFMAKLTG